MGVLRPQSGTFDEYFHGSLSEAKRVDWHIEDDRQVGHCAYKDDRFIRVHIYPCSFPVHAP